MESILAYVPCFITETTKADEHKTRPVFELLGHVPPPAQKFRQNIHDANKLRLWEEFINDGKEIVYIAQILECNQEYKGFPADALDYIEHRLDKSLETFYIDEKLIHERDTIRNKYVEEFIQILFQSHAITYNLKLNETIKKWSDKFETIFPDRVTQPIKNLLVDSEWQWEE